MLTSLDPNFHDAIIQRLSIDFQSKQTELLLKQWSSNGDGNYLLSHLVFSNVAWQDFKDFNSFNCLSSIEVSDSLSDFEVYQKAYLAKMNNYFAAGELKAIKENALLKYYYLTSSIGLDGFVICENLSVTQTNNTTVLVQ